MSGYFGRDGVSGSRKRRGGGCGRTTRNDGIRLGAQVKRPVTGSRWMIAVRTVLLLILMTGSPVSGFFLELGTRPVHVGVSLNPTRVPRVLISTRVPQSVHPFLVGASRLLGHVPRSPTSLHLSRLSTQLEIRRRPRQVPRPLSF